MTVELSRPDLERFAALMADRLGLALDLDGGSASLSAVLTTRVRETGYGSPTEYCAWLDRAELRVLAERLTIGETYFFRYREQFEALGAELPALLSSRGRPLRILSAGCSSGEEAGTLAILLFSLLPVDVARASSILGVDVNPAVVRKATRGRYSEWSLRETPAATRARWFRAHGRELELDPAARAVVSFAEANLGDPGADVWKPGAYDVVFCRNVLMYFTPSSAAAVVARIVDALTPGGLLFLGPTETHLGSVCGLSVQSAHGAFYHRRAGGAAPPASAWRPPDPGPAAHTALGDWASEVQSRCQTVAALSRARAVAPRAAANEEAPRAAADPPVLGLDRARELLRQDRAGEALAALPPGGERDPEALLLRGVLLLITGDVAGAERVGEAIVALDPLRSDARHLIALCRDHVGDVAGAVEHDRAAVYLDARAAMPHLQLGLLARRRGDAVEAARELRLAAALLAEDDADRLLFFGGGLHRGALIDLCRAELRALARSST